MVFLIKTNGDKKQILLQKRQNTGFADGMWDLSYAGHVEYKESMKQTAVREGKEELGVEIALEDLKFVTLIHKRDEACDVTYYNGYFCTEKYIGEPTICEPYKCSQIKWFDITDLPENLINDRKVAIKAYFNGTPYIEYGWGNN